MGTRFMRASTGEMKEERLFITLQKEKLINILITCLGLESTSIKVDPDDTGAFKKNLNPSENFEVDSPQKFIWFP